jgi:hypothetical protein
MTTLPVTERDLKLDILKGFGCLMMVVAHSSLSLHGYGPYAFYAGLAPALFFAVSGVTASIQASRYQPRGVLSSYLFLFLIGFSFNRITDAGFLEEINFDLLQMIAIGAALVYSLEYKFQLNAWIYFIFAIGVFVLKFPFLAALQDRIVYGISGIILPPGIFPVLPWLFLFFLGMFAYRTRNIWNVVIGSLGMGMFFLLPRMGYELDLENKWNMSVGYFFLALSVVLLFFFIVRLVPVFQRSKGMGLFLFLGTSSLLFLYVHFPIILYLKEHNVQRKTMLIDQNPYLFWLLVLGLTLPIMFILIRLARIKYISVPFRYFPTWIFLTMFVFIAGLFIKNENAVYWIEIGLGLLFALYYPLLIRLLKHPLSSDSVTLREVDTS